MIKAHGKWTGPILTLIGLLLATATPVSAQIDSSRRTNWGQVGIPGGIPNRSTVCSTLSPGASASQINSAISNCPSGQVVKLNAGTYNLTSGVVFNAKDGVTLRGAGPDQTILVFGSGAGTSCLGLASDLCLKNSTNAQVDAPAHSVSWTGGYAKGSTSITLASTSGLAIGDMLILDQLNDGSDSGAVYVCEAGNICADEGPAGGERSNRAQQQLVRVTGISGSTVSITPGLHMPNWRSSQSPQAFWATGTISNSGVEDLSLIHTSSDAQSGIVMLAAYNCWLKNVKSVNANRNHVWLYQTAASVIRDSYFYGSRNGASQSYGIEFYMSSDVLVENNILEHLAGPITVNGSASGSVVAYNYMFDDYYTVSPNWMIPAVIMHAAGVDSMLHEGNEGSGFEADVIHGTHSFVTAFRNYFIGWETGKTSQTTPVRLYAFSRYFNIVGNVLGRSGYHTQYESAAPSGGGSNTSIFSLGWSGHGTTDDQVPNDLKTKSTLLRWGNYDVATNTSRFETSEVPSGLSQYANAVPSQSLPSSLYLSNKPGWWGSAAPWPAIGPDVSGGPGPGGHAYKIPAHACFDATSRTSGILNFNANKCYGSVSTTPPPAAPANLRIIR